MITNFFRRRIFFFLLLFFLFLSSPCTDFIRSFEYQLDHISLRKPIDYKSFQTENIFLSSSFFFIPLLPMHRYFVRSFEYQFGHISLHQLHFIHIDYKFFQTRIKNILFSFFFFCPFPPCALVRISTRSHFASLCRKSIDHKSFQTKNNFFFFCLSCPYAQSDILFVRISTHISRHYENPSITNRFRRRIFFFFFFLQINNLPPSRTNGEEIFTVTYDPREGSHSGKILY